MDEIWKDVPEWEGLYSVSNLGRVKSHKRIAKHVYGYRTVNERIMKTTVDNLGYLVVSFRMKGRKRKTYKVHRLVGIVFLNVKEGFEINHLDGNKTNNQLSNLEVCTRLENQKHAIETGLYDPRKNNRKLTDKDVFHILKEIKEGKSMEEIGLMFSVSHQCIRDIKNGISWKHITSKPWTEIKKLLEEGE